MEVFTNIFPKLSKLTKETEVNEKQIKKYVASSFSVATLLTPSLGYEKVSELVKEAESKDVPILDLISSKKLIDEKVLEKLVSAKVMATPGLPLLEDE